MEFLRKLVDWFWEGLNVLMTAAMLLMIALVFVNVVLRYGFNSGILSTAEVSRLLFVWVTFCGSIICLRQRDHLELRLIENILPPTVLIILRRFIWLLIFVCCMMLIWGAWNQVGMNYYNKLPLSRIPVAVLYLAGVVGGIFMGLIAVHRFFVISADRVEEEETK